MARVDRSRRLARLAALAQRRELVEAQKINVARTELERQKTQQLQLESYQQDYDVTGLPAAGVAMVQNRRKFLERLNEAVLQQQGVVASRAAEVDNAVEGWRSAHQKTEVMASARDRAMQDAEQGKMAAQEAGVDELVNSRSPDRGC